MHKIQLKQDYFPEGNGVKNKEICIKIYLNICLAAYISLAHTCSYFDKLEISGALVHHNSHEEVKMYSN